MSAFFKNLNPSNPNPNPNPYLDPTVLAYYAVALASP